MVIILIDGGLMIGIYKFTNKSNNKVYIGQSINIEGRYKSHVNNFSNENLKDYNTKFYRALRKYGLNNFTFEIVEVLDDIINLNERETYWIGFYNSFKSGYNSTEGGHQVTPNNELHPNSKITNEQLLEIKLLLFKTKLTQYEIADKYELSQAEISLINTGLKWGNLGSYSYPIRKEEARKSGSSHHASVLTDEDVIKMRKRYVNETAKRIFVDYEKICSYITFERALMGRTYSYLPIYKKKEKKWIDQSCIDYPSS